MTRILRIVAVAACLAAAAGCITSGTKAPLPASGTDAAQYNLQLGISYFRQGKYDAAKEKLQRALAQDPNLATAHTALALVYERLEDPDGAEREHRRAAALAPDDPDVQNALGVFLCAQRDRQAEALRVFDKAIAIPLSKKTVNRAMLYTNAGTCAKYSDLPRAEAYLRRALAEAPNFPDALLQLAEVSLAQGNGLAARAFLERYLGARGPTAPALLLGSRIEAALGDAPAAARYAQQLRTDFPTAAEVRQLDAPAGTAGP